MTKILEASIEGLTGCDFTASAAKPVCDSAGTKIKSNCTEPVAYVACPNRGKERTQSRVAYVVLCGCMIAGVAAAHARSAVRATPIGSVHHRSHTPTLSAIVITAEKRTEDVQKTPLTVTVVNSQQLENQQINTISDLQYTSPDVTFGPPGESSPGGGAVIRGIGTVAFSRSASPSVGIVVDGRSCREGGGNSEMA
jgi:outer membrane receptor for monomeric catechols